MPNLQVHVDGQQVLHLVVGGKYFGYGRPVVGGADDPAFHHFWLTPWGYQQAVAGDVRSYFPWTWAAGRLARVWPAFAPAIFCTATLEPADHYRFVSARMAELDKKGG